MDGSWSKAPKAGAPSQLNTSLLRPGLLNSRLYYLHGVFAAPTSADMPQWIKHGGDKIPYHASATAFLAKCSDFII